MSLKKWSRAASKLIHRAYSISSGVLFNSSNVFDFFLELSSKRLYRSPGKEKASRCLFASSTKREIRHFHVAVVQWRQRNEQRGVMHAKLLFCQSKRIVFCRSRCCRRRCCLSILLLLTVTDVSTTCTVVTAPSETNVCNNPVRLFPFQLPTASI